MTINKVLEPTCNVSYRFASQQTEANTKYHNEHTFNKAFEICGYEIKVA